MPTKPFRPPRLITRTTNDKEKARQYLKEAKARGLGDRGRAGSGTLHSLEQPAYQKLLTALGLSGDGAGS